MAELFHIAERVAWQHAVGSAAYALPGPFIHLSARHQVLRPANLLYRGRTDLLLLVIDETALPPGALVWEPGSHGEAEDFPHLYAELPTAAVVKTIDFPCQADGTFELPEGV